MFNQTFQALLKEAHFTKEMLGAGATQIRKANYANKGIYFQAFTSLSTGLERIGKLCLMLDYYIETKGEFPDFKYLKNEIGHNITTIYEKSVVIKDKYSISFNFSNTVDDEIKKKIMTILSRFAEGDRYSNINLLIGSKQQSDPISEWFTDVDIPIFEKNVSKKRKEKILHNAQMIDRISGRFMVVQHIAETGEEINDVIDASYRTGIQESIAPYRQLYVLQIIRYWVELLWELESKAMQINIMKEDIPYLHEIFGGFYNDDSYFRTRKTWDTI